MIKESAMDMVDRMQGQPILILGDVMLDHYIVGGVERISPEAPVPVVRVESELYRLGGAGNVARNIATLGGRPVLAGCMGWDADGGVLANLLAEAGVESLVMPVDQRPTTRKTRIMAGSQQVVRVDWENGMTLDPDMARKLLAPLEARLADFPVIILSDYGKGVICQALLDRLEALIAGLPRRPRILVDPKPSQAGLYRGMDLLTPNAKEAGECAGRAIRSLADVPGVGRAIMDRLGLPHLLVTLGKDGMALFEGPDRVWHIPTLARQVFDVTGAGDTVIATLGLALAAGLPLPESCILSNFAAGVVVAVVGAASVTPEELKAAVASRAWPEPEPLYG